MRKTLLLLAVALATFAENAWADKSFKTLPELTYGVAISPSGQYLVGVNPSYMVDGSYSVSYLYDTNTGETQWLTEFDQNDFSKSGEFKAVNDAGVICGSSKDPDLLITYSDMFGTETRPANSAAIWKDGKSRFFTTATSTLLSLNTWATAHRLQTSRPTQRPSADISA